MTAMHAEARPDTPALAARRFADTSAVAERFFGEHADAIALACRDMAGRFQEGARLLVCGDDAQRSDVAHVVVEFLHPVVMGKRALPTIALPSIGDGGALAALRVIGRPRDIVLLIAGGEVAARGRELQADAARTGQLCLVLAGGAERSGGHRFVVPSHDPCIVQETHEIAYHVLWELVHVFLDHDGAPT